MIKELTRAELAKLFIESFESVEKGVNRMVRQACNGTDTWKNGAWHLTDSELRRFAALVVKAERDKVAHWIMDRGFTTKDADGIEELLQKLERQVCESIEDIIEAYEDKIREKNT